MWVIIVYHIWGVFIIRGWGGLLLGGGDYMLKPDEDMGTLRP